MAFLICRIIFVLIVDENKVPQKPHKEIFVKIIILQIESKIF